MTITGRGLIRRRREKYELPVLVVVALKRIIISSLKPGGVVDVNTPSLLKDLVIKHPGGSAYFGGNQPILLTVHWLCQLVLGLLEGLTASGGSC